MSFDAVLIVDWSAGNDRGPRPVRDAIWAGETGAAPVYLRNRDLAFDHLAGAIEAALTRGKRLLVGFDFPFGYPQGFARAVTGADDPLVLWDWFAGTLEDGPGGNNRFDLAGRLNARFPGTGPFWFNGLRREIPGLPRKGRARQGHGMPERRAVEALLPGAFTCWQMGGAGAVGGQVMTGMATLARLRRAFPGRIAAWPFEPLDRPIAIVEVWPSLIDAEIRARQGADEIRDAAQVRVLAEALARAPALDALLADVPAEARREEGWILGARQPGALAAGLR